VALTMKLLAVVSLLALLLPAPAAWAAPDHLRAALGLSAEAASRVEEVSDAELDEMRGRANGYPLAVRFDIDWSINGESAEPVFTETPYDPANGTGTLPDVSIHAFVGSLNNVNGIVQITQVPGNNNNITTVMNLNLTVINVANAAELSRVLQVAGF
jgi:hypothetical protein